MGFPTAFYLFPLFIPMETLPYRSKDRHDPAAEPFVICLYRGDYACEAREDEAAGACDPGGVFYGTDSLCEPVFCARHFYEMHFGPHAPYSLLD